MATEQVSESAVEPYHEQEPFLWDTKRYFGFISGVGAGKTAVGVMRTVLNAELWNRGSMGAIVAPSTRMIKNAIFPVMKDFGVYQRWEYKGPQAELPGFQTPDGGRLVVLSAADEATTERLANLNLGYWWLDEAKETPRRAREILSERLRSGNYRNGYITSTPNGYDHLYDFFVGGSDPEEYDYGAGRVYEQDDKLAIVGVPSWANPHTPDDYHEEMKNLPDGIRMQQAEGEFVEIGAGVFTRDMIQWTHVDGLGETVDRLNYEMAVDVGVESDRNMAETNDSDYWAISLGAVDPVKKDGYLIDCKRDRGMSLREGIQWIRSVANDVPSPTVYVESNAAQRWLKDELRETGLNAVPVQNTTKKEERIIQITIPLERGDIQFVNREVSDKLGYDPRFQDLVSEMLSFPEGTHDDLVDSLEILIDNMSIGSSRGILGASPYSKDNE